MEALFALTPENNIKSCQPDSVKIKQVLSKFENGKAAIDIPPELIKYARRDFAGSSIGQKSHLLNR